MRIFIYFSEDAIQVLKGSRGKYPKIMACRHFPLKSGTLINDIAVKEEEVKKGLLTVRDEFHGCKASLILGNSQILTKIIVVPSLNKRFLIEIVEKELQASYHITEDMVYDYCTLKERNSDNRGGTILGIGVKRQLIEYYEKLFKECGIRLREVDITLNAVLSMVKRIPELKDKSYILSIVDGRNLMSIVFAKGEYTYVNRYRIVSENNWMQAGYELVNHLNALIQFNRIQKKAWEAEEILICGVEKEKEGRTLSFLKNEISYNINVNFLNDAGIFKEAADLKYRLCDYPYVTGSLLRR